MAGKFIRVNGVLVQEMAVEKHNLLTTIGWRFRIGDRSRVVCQCECGTTDVYAHDSVRSGKTKSCGCHNKRSLEQRASNRGAVRISGVLVQEIEQTEYERAKIIGARFCINDNYMVVCECRCGQVFVTTCGNLRRGLTTSCGCYGLESRSKRSTTHGATVGDGVTPEYEVWRAMKARTGNENNPAYDRYGGRGITVCDRWLNSFEDFLSDMGPRPSLEHSIDRFPDNNGIYEPDNCRWATRQEQNNNTRRNVYFTFYGHTLTAAQWSLISNVSAANIYRRLGLGWSDKDAVWTPLKR